MQSPGGPGVRATDEFRARGRSEDVDHESARRAREGAGMGRPVVHFEIVGAAYERSRAFYSGLFGWEPDAANPMGYGVISREDNVAPDGVGMGGGITGAPPGYGGHLTVYVQVPNVGEALAAAERLGGTRMMGPDTVMEDLVIALFTDPDGNVVGVLQGR
jgi:uncharacterized protein